MGRLPGLIPDAVLSPLQPTIPKRGYSKGGLCRAVSSFSGARLWLRGGLWAHAVRLLFGGVACTQGGASPGLAL